MKEIKTIIFDFDGVLVDSVGIKDLAFEEMFKKYTAHYDEIMHYHKTHNAIIRFEKFEYIYKNILKEDFTEELKESLSSQYSQFVKEKIIALTAVKDSESFLHECHKKIPLYISSMNPEEEFKEILKARNIDRYFKGLYLYPWKKADALADILKVENINANEALYIGDSPEDYEAAKQNSINFIGRQSNRVIDETGVPIFSDFDEIKDYIEGRIQYAS